MTDQGMRERVLDLGSGGGILDVLLSARRVGPTGKAYGLDMTIEMLELARANAAKAGAENVEFIEGTIEDLPLPDASVDVVISNCVINLSTDKPAVLAEIGEDLRPHPRRSGWSLRRGRGDGGSAVSGLLARTIAPYRRPGAVSWVNTTWTEDNIDFTTGTPKILTNASVQRSDVVISMGCGDTCPFYPGKRYEDWDLDDPAGQGIDAVRSIRDEIKRRVQHLIATLNLQP